MSKPAQAFIRGIKTQFNSNTSRNVNLIKRVTKDIESAVTELRWLTEHVHKQIPFASLEQREVELAKLCKKRGDHVPLQYILGSQPFGELEIKCRPGVLIPRPETEAYTIHLAKLLNSRTLSQVFLERFKLNTSTPDDQELREAPSLNVLDLCSGSGCISLLLHRHLKQYFPSLSINGWDISPTAIALSNENLALNISEKNLEASAASQIRFNQSDIFTLSQIDLEQQLQDAHVIISNPPYISEEHFESETEESVRKFEPKLALVPDRVLSLEEDVRPEDIFYHQIIAFYTKSSKCSVVVMEVGDDEQAKRIVAMALTREDVRCGSKIEIWRDWPDQDDPDAGEDGGKIVNLESTEILVRGAGNMRAVVIIRE